jgi:hypothetical protein
LGAIWTSWYVTINDHDWHVLSPALRKGRWKILHVGQDAGGRKDGAWQLYDVVSDPGETQDLSEEYPNLMKTMLEEWEIYLKQTGTVWGQALPMDTKGWDGTGSAVIGGE